MSSSYDPIRYYYYAKNFPRKVENREQLVRLAYQTAVNSGIRAREILIRYVITSQATRRRGPKAGGGQGVTG
jgi:hypothetical protein